MTCSFSLATWQYLFQPRDQIFVKGYEFLFFAKNIIKNIGKYISKCLSGKYIHGMLAARQRIFDHAKQSATDALTTSSKRAIQKTAEEPGERIGIIIVDKITKVSKHSQHNNLETVTNENDKEIPKERYISTEKKIIYHW